MTYIVTNSQTARFAYIACFLFLPPLSMASSSDDTAAAAAINNLSAPPPTPSNHSLSRALSIDDNALSLLLSQLLSPTLSLSRPPCFNKRKLKLPPVSVVPSISLLQPQRDLLSNALTNSGFFHLTDHGISAHLPSSALIEYSNSLADSPINSFSSLGFGDDNDESDDDSSFLAFDTSSEVLDAFPAMKEYARGLQRAALEVVEMIFSTEGITESPFRNGTIRPRCLMWVSHSSSPSDEKYYNLKDKSYPYVVCLQYEMESQRKPTLVVGDSGSQVAVDPCVDSVLVALGDIGKVWSNGRFKKVRGIPQCNSQPLDNCDNSRSISMSLLVTLPMDSVVSPLSFDGRTAGDGDEGTEDRTGRKTFREFSFEEYAWRVHHDQLTFKDPLIRYEI